MSALFDVEHARQRFDTLFAIVEFREIDLRDGIQIIDLLALAMGEFERSLVIRQKRFEIALFFIEACELCERFARILEALTEFFPAFDGFFGAMEIGFSDFGLSLEKRDFFGGIGDIGFFVDDVVEVCPVVLLLVEIVQLLECWALSRIDFDDFEQRFDRFIDVRQTLAPEIGDSVVNLNRSFFIGRAFGLLIQDFEQVVPTLRCFVSFDERIDSFIVIGIDRQNLVIEFDHHGIVIRVLIVDFDALFDDFDAFFCLFGRKGFEVVFVDLE